MDLVFASSRIREIMRRLLIYVSLFICLVQLNMSLRCHSPNGLNFLMVKATNMLVYFCFYFCIATFDQSLEQQSPNDQSQSQNDYSAMCILWNLVADLVESNDENRIHRQQQITDFYSKAAATLPRIACMMQLYLYH